MIELIKYTHKELVEIAYKYALKKFSVGFAFKELYSLASEIPDVIAFGGWESVVLECKASRSDFLNDKKKTHRAKGMGNWRFYVCPKGMIKREELPEKWGLIYVDEKGKAKIEYDCRYKTIQEPCVSDWLLKEYPSGFYNRTVSAYENRFEPDLMEERRVMYTALRRLFIKGYVKHIYDKQYNKSSTVNELIMLNSDLNDKPSVATTDASSANDDNKTY